MIKIDILADHGNDWLTPKGKVDVVGIRAKHRAKHDAEMRARPPKPARPETHAKLERVMAKAKRLETARTVKVWNTAIAILDQSELALRDLIERSLVNEAGFQHTRYGAAMRAADRLMQRVAVLRAKAIKKAFRYLQEKLS